MSWSKSRILVSFTVLILIFSGLSIINSVLSASSSSAPWVVRQPMPLEKGDATAAVVNNKLYVFGGYIQGANDVRSETYEYDPSSDNWTQKAAMPTPRWGSIAVEYNEKIYVFGGYTRGYVWFDYFYKYPGNPLTTIPKYDALGVVHPDVIHFADGKDGYNYWMVYTPYPPQSSENPCIVRSNDGIIWTDAGISNPVVPSGEPSNWNDLENPDPDFVYVQDYDKWFMVWVGGNTATDSRKIALAYSSDGKTWTQYDGTPVNGNLNPVILSGDDAAGQPWERSSEGISKVCTPTLFYENGIFYLYYAEEASGNNYGKAGFATFSWNNTSNEIVNFERYSNNPTVSLPMDDDFYAGCGHLDISKNNGIFYMYVVRGVLHSNSYELAWLTSSDKMSWKYEGKALPRGTAGEWDNRFIYRSSPTVDPTGQIVKYDGKIKLYYSGFSESTCNIGIADIASNDHRANEVYDPATNTWEGKARVPDDVARQGLMGALYNNQIHLFYNAYHYVYNPSTDSYTRKANVPTRRKWGTAAVVNNKIYVIGGYSWPDGASNVNEAYNPITDTWETKTPLPVSLYGTTRENPVINGSIYVTHGLDNTNFYSTNYVYDPSTDSWKQKSSAFYARDGVACGVIGNRLYVVGGRADFVGPYGLNYNEEYDPLREGTWTQTTVSDFDSGTKDGVETTVINSSDGDVILQNSLGEDIIFSDDFNDDLLESGWTVDEQISASQWIKIDLGSTYSVDTVNVYQSNFPNYYTKDYQIQLSTDDNTYATVANNMLLNSINDLKINTFTATNARFVRILITSCYPRISQGLNEIEVFQTGQPATNIALNRPTTASSEWPSPNYSASHAVDGLKGTTANSAPYPWLCADDAKAVSGNTLEETNGELKIQAFQHSHAHIERQLGLVSDPIWLNVTARIKVSGSVGRTWRPMIAVYWAPGDWCGIGISGNEFITNLNVYSSQTEGFKSYAGAQPNFYIYVRIELTLTSIQFSESADGASWTTLRTETRPASYSGPPSLLIVGKGYGNGGWNQFGHTYPNPDLDNSFPGNKGQLGTSYIDDVVIIKKDVEEYASSGDLTSTVYDAGLIALWESINWTATTPPGTSIKLQTRTGNTSTPDVTWSNWSNFYYASGEVITSPAGRYIQYCAVLQTNDPNVTPVLKDITITYYAET